MKPGPFSFDDWCLLVVSNEKPFKQKMSYLGHLIHFTCNEWSKKRDHRKIEKLLSSNLR